MSRAPRSRPADFLRRPLPNTFSAESIFVVLLYAFIVVIALVSTATRAEGRRWLLERYENVESKNVRAGSRIFVSLLPLVGLLVIGEYLLLR